MVRDGGWCAGGGGPRTAAALGGVWSDPAQPQPHLPPLPRPRLPHARGLAGRGLRRSAHRPDPAPEPWRRPSAVAQDADVKSRVPGNARDAVLDGPARPGLPGVVSSRHPCRGTPGQTPAGRPSLLALRLLACPKFTRQTCLPSRPWVSGHPPSAFPERRTTSRWSPSPGPYCPHSLPSDWPPLQTSTRPVFCVMPSASFPTRSVENLFGLGLTCTIHCCLLTYSPTSPWDCHLHRTHQGDSGLPLMCPMIFSGWAPQLLQKGLF